MRIYIVSIINFPNGMAPTSRIQCLAKAMKLAGAEVSIITYQRTESPWRTILNTEASGSYEGIPFMYIGGKTVRSRIPPLNKIIEHLDRRRLLKYLRTHLHPKDIVYMYEKNCWEFSVELANTVHEKEAFYVKDLCEIPYGDRVVTESMKGNRKNAFKYEYPLVDAVVPISDKLMDITKRYSSSKCKFLKVPILVDFDKFKLADHSVQSDFPYIFHTGKVTEQKDGILGMIEAFGRVVNSSHPELRFICTGNYENTIHAEAIDELKRKYHLKDKLIFLGYISQVQLKDYLSKATMVIINKYQNEQNTYCFATKLAEYLAAAKPVIISDYGEAVNWIKDKESAIVFSAGDTEALVESIEYVLDNPSKCRMIASEGQNVCKNCFDYKVWGQPIIELFRSLG